ncbi:MAG: hypothetical protein CMJ64_03690 [Planctomycetaceae bacterium]|nr:hypothetical protein [Planctomycetaceae bacterium]
MIDLTQSDSPSPLVHTVPCDPGTSWISDSIAIDAPPDSDIDPAPDAQWPAEAERTGVCGAVCPRVVALPSGGYRMYYTQILPRAGFPAGANDYDNATSRILSATSSDGMTWPPEPGARLLPQEGGAGDFRVVSSEVVPSADGGGRLRMYYECCEGPQSQQNSIRSAVSNDGLLWTAEAGSRFELSERSLSSPRIIFLDDGRCRLYCSERGRGIISAVSDDGVTFEQEPGVRVAPDQPFDRYTAFAPEILCLKNGSYRMYYAGYSEPTRANILTAASQDGLHWQKASDPVVSPGPKAWDAAKCSEMCVIWSQLGTGNRASFRMFYEACDGTAPDRRGVWRIASSAQGYPARAF